VIQKILINLNFPTIAGFYCWSFALAVIN